MKKTVYLLLALVTAQLTFSQEQEESSLDLNYREDQFYLSVTYDLLGQMPSEMAQNGFSSGRVTQMVASQRLKLVL